MVITSGVALTTMSAVGFSLAVPARIFSSGTSNYLADRAAANFCLATLACLGSLGGGYGISRLNHVNRPGAILGTLTGLAAGGCSLFGASGRFHLIGEFNPKQALQGAVKIALATSAIVGGLFGLGSDLYKAYKNRNKN